MIGMSEAIAPISAGMEFPLPLSPIGGESIDCVKSSHIPPMPKDIPQWESFKEYSQSLPLVAKELGDRMEGKNVGPHVSRDRGRVVCASLPVVEVKEPETPFREVLVASRVTSSEVKEPIAPETSRVDKPEIVQTEASRIEKPEISQLEAPRINKPEMSQLETPLVGKPDHSQLKEIEKPVKEVVAPSLAPADEKPEVTLVDIASARVSQNTVVQTPESAVVSRLVETVVETLAVTPTLSSTGEGEIRIQLKSDILDGSSIKIEVKNGELKVVVEPASHTAEQILIKSQETFQNQLAERVTAWRVNVGIAAFDSRSGLRRRLEEQS